MRKPLNSSIPEELIAQIDEYVIKSRGDYRDRSHLVEQALKSYLGENLSLREALSKTLNGVKNTSVASSLYETSLFPRLSLNTREKQAIAVQAATLVEPNKTLFLDGGTTCIQLARILAQRKKRQTIVTNSTLICLELGQCNEIKIIGVGGEFDPASASFVGRTCEEALENFYVDYAITSTKGFLPAEGTFESSMGTLRIKQVVADHCGQLILLVDYSKFGQRSLCKVLDISQIGAVVTDRRAPQEAVDLLQQTGHQILVAELPANAEIKNALDESNRNGA
jgi:DeoR/GlpR family transcriptional regulator of sugar metabolism